MPAQDITGRHLRFFDDVFGGIDNSDAPVRIFVMGIDAWRDEADWSPPDAAHVLSLVQVRQRRREEPLKSPADNSTRAH